MLRAWVSVALSATGGSVRSGAVHSSTVRRHWHLASFYDTIRPRTMVTAFAILLLIGLGLVSGYLIVMAVAVIRDWASQRP